jgi:rhodanese-related sulfurtransferase
MAQQTQKTGIAAGLERFRAEPGAVLLDVRTAEEYAAGHIPGSVNLPLSRISDINSAPETPLFVYCRSGARSMQACLWLARSGYRAENIGGIVSYAGPLEK